MNFDDTMTAQSEFFKDNSVHDLGNFSLASMLDA